MRHTFTLILVTFIFLNCCKAQTIDWKAREIKHDTDLLKTTTWLILSYDTSKHNPKFGTGTGYFYYSSKSKKIFLVTNAHVVSDFDLIKFGFENNKTRTNSFAVNNFQNKVYRFFNDTVDLAMIDLSNIDGLDFRNCDMKCFTNSNIPRVSDLSSIDLFRENLICLSFPNFNIFPPNNSPFIIHGTFATSYSKDFWNKNEFCINGNLFASCSGSPIIDIINLKGVKSYYLLGTYYFGFAQYRNVDSVGFGDSGFLNRISAESLKAILIDVQIGRVIKSSALYDIIKQRK